MRILFYNHTGLYSGAERVLFQICSNLDRCRFEPRVVCPPGDLAKQIRELGIPVVDLPEVKARFTSRIDKVPFYCASILRTALALRGIVAASAPDLVHANGVRAGIIASLATVGMRVQVIWHVHDILEPHPFSTAIRLLTVMRGVRQIVAVSKATADAFEGRLLKIFSSRAPVQVIYNGIEGERFRPDPEARLRKRAALGLTDTDIAVGIIGQISPRKRQIELVMAFEGVMRASPAARLFVAGTPVFEVNKPYYEAVRKEVKRGNLSERICLLGHCPDTPDLMRALDIVVNNSRAEPCSLVIVEALASGAAVLATNVGGNPELIKENQTGFLLRNLDTRHLTNRLLEIIADPELRRSVGEQGRQSVLSSFGIARFVRDFHRFYESLDAGRPLTGEPAG